MGSIGTKQDQMNVPYDEWGETWRSWEHNEDFYDENGEWLRAESIEDNNYYETEPDVRPLSKTEALKEPTYWKNDDDTYGNGDEAIYIAYEDGHVLDLTDGEPHKRWSKQGISGVYVSTADYQMAWGGEWHRPNAYSKYTFSPYETTEYDDNANAVSGHTNSYSGARTVAEWKQRVKTITYRDEKGRIQTKRETIRKSTKKRFGYDKKGRRYTIE